MSARRRFITTLAFATAAFAVVAPAAHAAPVVPPGATVSDKLICLEGHTTPDWLVSMANSGPNPLIDFTLHSDNFATVDYEVGPGPLIQRYMPAHNGSSHLTVLADGAPFADTTQSLTCGSSNPDPTTTTTVKPTTTTTAAPATTTTVASHANGDPSPTTVKAVVHTATAQDPPANQLPFTGSSSLPLGLAGSTLVLAGVGAVYGSRRKAQ